LVNEAEKSVRSLTINIVKLTLIQIKFNSEHALVINKIIFILKLNFILRRRKLKMSKFLIEVSHEAEKNACLRAAQILLKSGSHFVTNADFGCLDGEHKAWIVVDVSDKEAAKTVLPPEYRSSAKIVKLNKFTLKEIEELLAHH
jgi:replicative superfamily II helicase